VYRPPAFVVDDAAALDAFVDAHPFALITTVAENGPVITHAPVLRDGAGALVCHLARPNPHGDLLAARAPTTVVFAGPHGYVSPRWYATTTSVPTWNYTAVHARVAAEELTDRDALRAAVDALVERFEPDPGIHEVVTADVVEGMLRGIRGFRLRVLGVEGNFKLSQNRSAADRAGVVAGLAARGGGDGELAAFMEAHGTGGGR
jgi:transcriptional regulator